MAIKIHPRGTALIEFMPETVTSYGKTAIANFVVKQQRHSYGTQSYDSGGVMQTRPVWRMPGKVLSISCSQLTRF